MKKSILMLCGLAFCGGVWAQQVFTLSQSVSYALEQNPSLALSRNQVASAHEQSRQALAGYLPQVGSSATFIDNFQLQTTLIPAGIFGPTETPVQLGTQYNTTASVDLSQTVFDRSKLLGIQAAKPYIAITELQAEQSQENVAYNTAVAYFQALTYREQEKILRNNQAKNEELLKVLSAQVRLGVALQRDYDRVQASINNTRYQLEDVAVRQQLALNTLKNAMGMPIETPLEIGDSIDYASFARLSPSDTLDVSVLTESRMADQQIRLGEISLDVKKATFLPVITAIAKVGTQSQSNTLGSAFTSWNGYSYAGLSLNLPIFNGFKRQSLIAEERLNLQNDLYTQALTQENLKLRYENARASVSSAYTTYLGNKENLALTENLLEVTAFQYEKGAASLSDYLNDDAAWKNAQSNYLSSLYSLMISQINY
ncbi:MAG: TolC family protein, partial [Bacteroidetes bacterium]